MSLRDEIKRLAHQMEREDNAAHDLWTWLPSYAVATKGHGDYASNHRPSIADVMIEASTFISHGLHPTAEERDQAGDIYDCPCGEPHVEESSGAAEPVASFEAFVRELHGDIARFARHWSEQHRADPERFPMSFHRDNAGAWFEQFIAFVNSTSS